MSINKCKTMIISIRACEFVINLNVVRINSVDLHYVEQMKYIVVVIDCKLSFHIHAEYVLLKNSSKHHFQKEIAKSWTWWRCFSYTHHLLILFIFAMRCFLVCVNCNYCKTYYCVWFLVISGTLLLLIC